MITDFKVNDTSKLDGFITVIVAVIEFVVGYLLFVVLSII